MDTNTVTFFTSKKDWPCKESLFMPQTSNVSNQYCFLWVLVLCEADSEDLLLLLWFPAALKVNKCGEAPDLLDFDQSFMLRLVMQ